MSGRGKRENYGKGRVDPNAVHMGGKDKGVRLGTKERIQMQVDRSRINILFL